MDNGVKLDRASRNHWTLDTRFNSDILYLTRYPADRRLTDAVTNSIIAGPRITVWGTSSNIYAFGSDMSIRTVNNSLFVGNYLTHGISGTGSLMLGTNLTIGSRSDYNLMHGQTTQLGDDSRHNFTKGESMSVGNNCEYNISFGNGLSVGNGSTNNILFGNSANIGTTSLFNAIIGETSSIGNSCKYNLLVGKDNTLSGNVWSSLAVGMDNTIDGNYSYIFGADNKTFSGSDCSLVVGRSNETKGSYNFAYGYDNAIGITTDYTNSYSGWGIGYGNTIGINTNYNYLFGSSNTAGDNCNFNFVTGIYNVVVNDTNLDGNHNLVTGKFAKAINYGCHVHAGGHPTLESILPEDMEDDCGGGQNIGMIPHTGSTTTNNWTSLAMNGAHGANPAAYYNLEEGKAMIFVSYIIGSAGLSTKVRAWKVESLVIHFVNGGLGIYSTEKTDIGATGEGTEVWDVEHASINDQLHVRVKGPVGIITNWQGYSFGPEIRSTEEYLT